jgi:hypothetical protein
MDATLSWLSLPMMLRLANESKHEATLHYSCTVLGGYDGLVSDL